MIRVPLAVFFLLFCLRPAARAEEAELELSFSPVGPRALAMAGAFTAVADDATAFFWNPAGVAHGELVRVGVFGGTAFRDRGELVNRLAGDVPGGEGSLLASESAVGFAIDVTAFGFSLTRVTATRSMLDGDVLRSHAIEATSYAVTLVHTLPFERITVGGNVRYLRGTAYQRVEPAAEIPRGERSRSELIDRATDAPGVNRSRAGLDLGLLYQVNDRVRLGASFRNLNRPQFQVENGAAMILDRHARAGVALFLPRGLLVSVDCDLTARRVGAAGEAGRELALGVERTWAGGRVSARGGARAEAVAGGLERPGFSAGLGVRLRGIELSVAAIAARAGRQGGLWLGASLGR